jgi:hypothetical protein
MFEVIFLSGCKNLVRHFGRELLKINLPQTPPGAIWCSELSLLTDSKMRLQTALP